MPGNFKAYSLAKGRIGSAQIPLYVVPASTTAYVKQIYLASVVAATQNVALWLEIDGDLRSWHPQIELAVKESAHVLEHGESVQLNAGDRILAQSTDAASVDYIVTGVEET
jgi:hypothetical protein